MSKERVYSNYEEKNLEVETPKIGDVGVKKNYEEQIDETRQQHVIDLAREQALKDNTRIDKLRKELAELTGNTPEKQQREVGLQKREEILKRFGGDENYEDIKGEIPQELFNDKNFILETLSRHETGILADINEELKSDRNFILEATGVNSSTFEVANEALQNDEEFALEALKNNSSLVYNDSFKKVFGENKNFILKAKEIIGGGAVQLIEGDLKNDKELLLQLADVDALGTLRNASNELISDEEFVLKIVESISKNIPREKSTDVVPPIFYELEKIIKLLPKQLTRDIRFREEIKKILIETMKGSPDEYLPDKNLTRQEVYEKYLKDLFGWY